MCGFPSIVGLNEPENISLDEFAENPYPHTPMPYCLLTILLISFMILPSDSLSRSLFYRGRDRVRTSGHFVFTQTLLLFRKNLGGLLDQFFLVLVDS